MWVMKKVNIFEVKAKFAEYLERAGQGERIVIYRYNEPVAELRALEPSRTEPRPVGPVAGRPTFDLSPSFFEPIDDDELAAWEGTMPAGTAYPRYVPDTTARVAEEPPAGAYSRTPRRTRRRRS